MPLYEYRCQNCRRRSTVLIRSLSQVSSPSCEHCGSTNLVRLISSFAVHRSFAESLDWVPGAETLGDVDENDPRSVARWMRRMKKEMGEEVTPEFEQMIDELEVEAEKAERGELDDQEEENDLGGDLNDADL